MTFTEEQAREAMRQHPRLVNEMHLSVVEMRIYLNRAFDSDSASKVGFTNKNNAARALRDMEKKGYLVRLDKYKAVYGPIIYRGDA